MKPLRYVWIVLSTLTLAAPLRAGPETPAFQPDPLSVQRHGPAYRYPQAGWIVLHIEGTPYERGYQHGRLLAPEIAGHLRCFAAVRSHKDPEAAWKLTRTLVNALFLRRFHPEFLEEMKGIADGAAAGGAKFDKRPVDLLDVAAFNCWAELETLDPALEALPTGLEGVRFPNARPKAMPAPKPAHCSAFAATGPATADGKVVFGHITMFGLYPANFYNVWLDIQPAKGHRVLMQTYPGGIQSGMDYYLNDAGLIVCETTIDQTRFDIKGLALASRIRQALQYSDSIDKVVATLQKENNGLYTNEWLLADVKTNEIAMFELGTHKSRLWRSSKNEWFGGTPGFYWGCNNTKDLDVRLETIPGPLGRPQNLVWQPSERDRKWQELYAEHKGKIDPSFGRRAFTTPPVAGFHSLDAKYTTTDLAKELKTWALFGPPLGRTWQPTHEERQNYPEIRPLVSNPWTVLGPPSAPRQETRQKAVDLATSLEPATAEKDDEPAGATVPLWHGTLLPKTGGDVWLAAAFAEYEKLMAREAALRDQRHELTSADRDRLAVELFGHRSAYLAAARAAGDVPLSKIKSEPGRDEWYRIASGKGVLLLHELRRQLGDPLFENTMDAFGRAHAGKAVGTADFRRHCEKAAPQAPLAGFFDSWLHEPGLPKDKADGGGYTVYSFRAELEKTLIVYGTKDETAANREAAEALQRALIESGPNLTVPIKADAEVSEGDLKSHHVLLIGRPDSHALLARFREKLPISFGSRSFVVRDEAYAHPASAVFVAADNPVNPRYSMVVLAGLSADATARAAPQLVQGDFKAGEVVVLPHALPARSLVLPAKELTQEQEPSAKQVRAAVSRALPLLEKGAKGSMEERPNCFTCHNQGVPILALTTARDRGFVIDEDHLQEQIKFTAQFLDKNRANYRQGKGQGGQIDTAGYALWTLEVGGWKPDATTEAVMEYFLLFNKELPHWRVSARRPPSEQSHFTANYLAVRALRHFGAEPQKEAITRRIDRVRDWLRETKAEDTEDRVFRLWALKVAGADEEEVQAAAKELLRTQRADGGWGQTDAMESDAYATGTALVVLHQAGGLAVTDPMYRRGLMFLLCDQLGDGSWYVRSRSRPFQTYFESGFPHGKDQFISMAASGWATTALALACEVEQGER